MMTNQVQARTQQQKFSTTDCAIETTFTEEGKTTKEKSRRASTPTWSQHLAESHLHGLVQKEEQGKMMCDFFQLPVTHNVSTQKMFIELQLLKGNHLFPTN